MGNLLIQRCITEVIDLRFTNKLIPILSLCMSGVVAGVTTYGRNM